MINISKAILQKYLTAKNPQLIEQLQEIIADGLPLLMFAAIDNDLLPKVELIKHYILKQGKLPIVGESALGTYLATTHHKGKKEFILRDCLSLIDLCDDFNIFVDSKESSLLKIIAEFPDGVFYEAAYWFSKGKTRINIVNIHDFLLPDLIPVDSSIFKNLAIQFKQEIFDKLQAHATQKHITTYALMPEGHTKYIDWIRKDIYQQNQVPVIPHILATAGSVILAQGDKPLHRMLNRVAIAARCQKICIFAPMKGNKLSFENLSLDILLEIYLIMHFDLNLVKNFAYKSYADVGVPKYSQTKQWAITTKESNETREEQEGGIKLLPNSAFVTRLSHFARLQKNHQTASGLTPVPCNYLSKL